MLHRIFVFLTGHFIHCLVNNKHHNVENSVTMRSLNYEKYKIHLVEMMSFIDGVTYHRNYEFTPERLLQLTDEDVARFFCHKAYGKAEPAKDDRPTKTRSSTLAYAKKAISYFMPRRASSWDPITGIGNPTKSQTVNDVILGVKRYEVRGQGVNSRARRPVEWEEFVLLLVLTRHLYSTSPVLLVMVGVLTVQWQLIGRIDDVMKLDKSTIKFNLQSPFTLMIKMCWSKNIRDERESPVQILFGSMDPLICPLLNLAAFLEFGDGNNSTKLFGSRSNRSISNILERIFSSPLFRSYQPGPLGTHSIRKGAATFASQFGLPKVRIF